MAETITGQFENVSKGLTVSELFEQLSAGVRDPMTDEACLYYDGLAGGAPMPIGGGVWGEDPYGNRVLVLTFLSMKDTSEGGGF